MSITVRLRTDEGLEATRTDKWLATLLMNTTTLSEEMALNYPYSQRRVYKCQWFEPDNEYHDHEDVVTIYATDERMLLKYIDAEYTRRPELIHQVITQYRPIKH